MTIHGFRADASCALNTSYVKYRANFNSENPYALLCLVGHWLKFAHCLLFKSFKKESIPQSISQSFSLKHNGQNNNDNNINNNNKIQ